jgi:hypothetical protein
MQWDSTVVLDTLGGELLWEQFINRLYLVLYCINLYYYISIVSTGEKKMMSTYVHLLVRMTTSRGFDLSRVSHQETFAGFQKSVRVLPTADVEVELGTADDARDST